MNFKVYYEQLKTGIEHKMLLRKNTFTKIQADTGVARQTVRRVLAGDVRVRASTLIALERWLEKGEDNVISN
jgi:hypothetical protein